VVAALDPRLISVTPTGVGRAGIGRSVRETMAVVVGTFPGPLGRAGGTTGPLGLSVGGRCVEGARAGSFWAASVVLTRGFWHPCRVLAMCGGRNRGGRCARPPAHRCHPDRGRLWRGGRGSRRVAAQGARRSPSPAQRAGKDRPRHVPAQRANRSSRGPRGSWNGWPVGPNGVVVAATRASDPGWENGWPCGPNDGPSGTDNQTSVERSDTSGGPAATGRGIPKGVRERVGSQSDVVGVAWGNAVYQVVGSVWLCAHIDLLHSAFTHPSRVLAMCVGRNRGWSLRSTPGSFLSPRSGWVVPGAGGGRARRSVWGVVRGTWVNRACAEARRLPAGPSPSRGRGWPRGRVRGPTVRTTNR
jgi:hypothetical protein